MATFYSEKEQQKILKELHIAPVDGKVDGSEAARILTWRAKQEHDVEYAYDATSIRQQARQGNFPEGTIDTSNSRHNLYLAQSVFSLPIAPRRGASRKGKA